MAILQEKFDTKKLVDSIEGRVTVELFNAKTGKLEHKAQSNNFIAQAAIRHLQWAQRNYYFKDQIYTLNNALDVDYQPIDVYNSIVLTDSTVAEAPSTEWYMPGKLIGYSTKDTYTGSDTLRGSPNAAESAATATYTKWVFDWPTTAANGTIGSVGWMHKTAITPSSTGGLFCSGASVVEKRTSNIPFHQYIARTSSNTYMGAYSTTIYNLDSNFQQTGSFNVAGQFSTIYGVAWDDTNSKLWVIGYISSTWKLASYNSSGSLIDGPITLTSRTYQGLTYDGTDLYTIGDLDSIPTVYKLSTAGADISNFTFSRGDQYYSSYMHYEYVLSIAYNFTTQKLIIGTSYTAGIGGRSYAEQFYASYSGRFFMVDTDGSNYGVPASSVVWASGNPTSRISPYVIGGGGSYPFNQTPDFDLTPDGDIIIPYRFNSYITNVYVYKIRLDGMGSRTRLASPVTKNNTQTMKITYQMNYSS